MGKLASMGFTPSFMEIYDTMHSWLPMPLYLLAKRLNENESKGGYRER
jgi:hypothetical protein